MSSALWHVCCMFAACFHWCSRVFVSFFKLFAAVLLPVESIKTLVSFYLFACWFSSYLFPFCFPPVHPSGLRPRLRLCSCHRQEEKGSQSTRLLQSVWTRLTFGCEKPRSTRSTHDMWGYFCRRVTDGRTGPLKVMKCWTVNRSHVRKSIKSEEFVSEISRCLRWTSSSSHLFIDKQVKGSLI